jgi:hypothetical protein
MESFQSHLSTRLTNRLCCDSSNSFSSLDHRSLIFFPDKADELIQLRLCDIHEIPQKFLNHIVFPFLFDVSLCDLNINAIFQADVLSDESNLFGNTI